MAVARLQAGETIIEGTIIEMQLGGGNKINNDVPLLRSSTANNIAN